jgi:hypothetical protein
MTAAILNQVVCDVIAGHDGVRPVEQGEGDSFVAAFARASDAVACASELQLAPLAPNRLRIGVHTGEIQLRDEANYAGPTINRTARLRDLAHGGQTVLSGATEAMVVDVRREVPMAVAKIVDDADVLLEFYRYPAEHWVHLRATNPIESNFATVRLRTKVTKRPGSRAAGVAIAYKLIEAVQTRWRAVNSLHLVALVRNGAVFHKGKLLERPIDITPAEPDESHGTLRLPGTCRRAS